MNGLIVLLIVVLVPLACTSWIRSKFSPVYRKRSRDRRARISDKITGFVFVVGAIVALALAALDYVGLIDVDDVLK